MLIFTSKVYYAAAFNSLPMLNPFFYPTIENWKFEKLQVNIYWFCVLKRKGYRAINVQINISFLLCERF